MIKNAFKKGEGIKGIESLWHYIHDMRDIYKEYPKPVWLHDLDWSDWNN